MGLKIVFFLHVLLAAGSVWFYVLTGSTPALVISVLCGVGAVSAGIEILGRKNVP